jgi:hypothetical protein
MICAPTIGLAVIVFAYLGASMIKQQQVALGTFLMMALAVGLIQALCMYTSDMMAWGALLIVGAFFVLSLLSVLGVFGSPSAGPQPCGSCGPQPKPCGPPCPRCHHCRRRCRCLL